MEKSMKKNRRNLLYSNYEKQGHCQFDATFEGRRVTGVG